MTRFVSKATERTREIQQHWCDGVEVRTRRGAWRRVAGYMASEGVIEYIATVARDRRRDRNGRRVRHIGIYDITGIRQAQPR